MPAAADFWVRDGVGRITHDCTAAEPLVMCMQGRRVVMQVQAGSATGFSYTARFFNLQPDAIEKKRVLFKVGREWDPEVRIDDQPLPSLSPSSAAFDGMLTMTYPLAAGVIVTRTVYPSTTKALIIEQWRVRNTTGKPLTVTIPPARRVKPLAENIAVVWTCRGGEPAAVKPGGEFSFSTCRPSCRRMTRTSPSTLPPKAACCRPWPRRLGAVAGRLETPEPQLDMAFALQKFHVLENPIETCKGVITHNGSLTYSPGIWANDPVEYSSPLFPLFGDAELNRAWVNMYRVWQDYCRQRGIVPFPGLFQGAALKFTQRERGDDAMVLYGLSQFLLFQGDRSAALELWP